MDEKLELFSKYMDDILECKPKSILTKVYNLFVDKEGLKDVILSSIEEYNELSIKELKDFVAKKETKTMEKIKVIIDKKLCEMFSPLYKCSLCKG